MIRDDFPFDRRRMLQATQDIAADLLKQPGQPLDLGEDERFALTVMMLTKLLAVLVATRVPDVTAGRSLIDIIGKEAKRSMAQSVEMIHSAKAMGFGSVLPWSMLTQILTDEEQP
jgi:hypothetical protein